jgi:hypothetical protein
MIMGGKFGVGCVGEKRSQQLRELMMKRKNILMVVNKEFQVADMKNMAMS